MALFLRFIVFWTMLIAIKKIHDQVWRRSKQPHDSNISDTQTGEDTDKDKQR